MKKGALSFLVAGVLCMVLAVASCGDGGDTPTDPSSSSSSGGDISNYPEMSAAAGVVQKVHDWNNTNCLNCHGATIRSKNNQKRVPTSMANWWSPYQSDKEGKDVYYKVVAGSDQDHTNYGNTDCLKSGCHQKP